MRTTVAQRAGRFAAGFDNATSAGDLAGVTGRTIAALRLLPVAGIPRAHDAVEIGP
jgi:hypothetical protein